MDIKTILGEAHTDEIEKAILKEIGKEFIPKAKFDEANEAKKTAESVIAERDKQIAELSKVNPADLQKKIEELTTQNTEAAQKYQTDLENVKRDALIETALIKSGAVHTKAVKALLDGEKIKLDGDTLKGLDEQLTALQETEKWAFQARQTQAGTKEHGNGGTVEKTVKEELKEQMFNKTQ